MGNEWCIGIFFKKGTKRIDVLGTEITGNQEHTQINLCPKIISSYNM